jgi:tetratricopeptide (TPR) repeat protein
MSRGRQGEPCRRARTWLRLALAALGLAFILQAQAQSPAAAIAEAEALLRAGRAAAAYEKLAALEDQHAGEPAFDYVLGVAALDSGRPDRATLAFERVLAVDPGFAGARLDMARAYFNLGDLARSRAEFESVLAQNPPAQARAVIERYLEVIAEREAAKRTVVKGYVELGVGRDDNVNNSTSQANVAVPALGNLVFTLDPSNVQRSDAYLQTAAALEVTHELVPGASLFGGATLRGRKNESLERFDYESVEGRGGVAWGSQEVLLRLQGSRERFTLAGSPNRTSEGVTADARYVLAPDSFVSTFLQQSNFAFEDPQLTVNDFKQTIGGAGWVKLFQEGRSAFSATLFGGKETDRNGRADGGKDLGGVRFGGQFAAAARLDLFAALGQQHGRYQRENAAFLVTRRDRLTDMTLGLIWKIAGGLSLRPQLMRIKNASNIPIYQYTRDDLFVALRYDF